MSQTLRNTLLHAVCVLILSLVPAFAQLNGVQTGTIGPGYYTVVGNLVLNAGDTLRIEAGTTLQFIGQFRFDVNGTLLAQGTQADSIVFTCDTLTLATRWRKIRFNGAASSGSVLEYCIIENSHTPNTFPQFNGGGVYCSGSSPYFRSCTFRFNQSDQAGGGVYCTNSLAIFSDCSFENNQSGSVGGGLAVQSSSHVVVDRCLFAGNVAVDGGALSAQSSSRPIVSYTTIIGNMASHYGGAVNAFSASPEFYDCHFRYNRSTVNGGTAAFFFSTPQLDHCSIAFDSTAIGGASILIEGGSPQMSSTLFCCSDQYGFNFRDAESAQIEYCSISGFAAGNFSWFGNNVLEGPSGIGVLTQRNVNRDSCDQYFNLFLDPQILDTSNGVYFPQTCYSSLIGAGKPQSGYAVDITGAVRPDPPGSVADIGGFESEQSHPGIRGLLTENYGPGLYVICDTISILHPDSSRLLPGTTFQFIGDVPFNVTGKFMAEGTETDSIYFKTDTLANPDRWRGIRFTNQNTSSSRLRFCVFEDSKSTGAGSAQDGGAIYCSSNSSPQFFDCSFRRTGSDNFGGAVYASNSSPQFTRCNFNRQLSEVRGGTVYLSNSLAIFTGCALQNSRSVQQAGGAIYVTGGAPQLTRLTICEGSATQQGGGVHLNATTATLNSVIISHCTGAGLYLRSSPNAIVRYDDVFGNSGGNIVLHNNSASNGPVGIGLRVTVNANGDSTDSYFNFSLDPQFEDRGNGDLHLLEFSPCIDGGDALLSSDSDGTIADIGAYYFDQGLLVDSLVVLYQASGILLSWTSQDDLFNIYGASSVSAVGELLATVADTSWTDSQALSRGLAYFYWVKSVQP